MNGGLYIVAGATGAIGKSLCHRILKAGGTPLLIGRCPEKLRAIHEELSNSNNTNNMNMIANIDFSDPMRAGEVLSKELKSYPAINGIAYCVGSIVIKPMKACHAINDYVHHYNINVLGAIELLKASLPGLKKATTPKSPESMPSTSSVVLFSSVAVQHGFVNHSVIGCTKGAVEGLTKSLAAEFSASNIRVNCIAPSLTTQSSMALSMTANETMAQAIAKSHPIQRLGTPEDSSAVAAFLLSNDSSWMTGAVIPIDGGRSTILK